MSIREDMTDGEFFLTAERLGVHAECVLRAMNEFRDKFGRDPGEGDWSLVRNPECLFEAAFKCLDDTIIPVHGMGYLQFSNPLRTQ